MKNSKNRIEEFIRVDHAGERGAVKIYEGQLLALNTLIKNENLKKIIEEMKVHEKEHCEFFEKEIKKRKIRPTKIFTFMGFIRCWFRFWLNPSWKKSSNVMYCICRRSY